MPRTTYDRVIALAGLFQAVSLVRDIAHNGQTNLHDLEISLGSLLKINTSDSAEVYGGVANLRCGLTMLHGHLLKPKEMEVTRYAVSLLTLERKLARQPLLLDKIREGITQALDKLDYFPLNHENMLAHLADIYATTVSTLTPRIMVNGQQIHLTQPENANRIRALLLAGIRAAILWRQNGGKRWTLIFSHKMLSLEAQTLLASLAEEEREPH